MARVVDLEASTFQKRPAYRYIRKSDNVPALGATSEEDNPIARVKLFNPTGGQTWYIAEYDPETRTAYGIADGQAGFEYGYINMVELVDFRGRFSLPIERDLHWAPKPLSEIAWAA